LFLGLPPDGREDEAHHVLTAMANAIRVGEHLTERMQ
jgi:hypothetical protein